MQLLLRLVAESHIRRIRNKLSEGRVVSCAISTSKRAWPSYFTQTSSFEKSKKIFMITRMN